MVEAAQSLGCTSAGETGSSIAQCNIGEADSFMDLTVPCRNDAAACDKQQSSSSSAVSGPVAGDETDVVRSECDQTNEDTVDRIIMAPPTIVEKEMDDMFKEGIYPTIQEVTEALEPEGGMVFGSLDECFLFFCRYARKVGFAAKRSTSRRSTYDQQLDKQVFQCTKEGQNKTTERHVKERRSNCLIRTSCPVQITAKRDTDRRKWYLKNVRLEHNHQLHPSDWMLKFMRCYKKMTPQEKFFIQVLQKARLEPRKVMQIFTAMGKPRREIMFDTIDISNIACRDRAGERGTDIADTMKMFADMQRRRPGFHHVEETENNVVRSLFWTDSLCKMNYDLYGDFVSFDTTFSTNIYGLPFAPIIGVDNHGSTVLFGVGLLKDEKIGSFKWLLSTFVEAMGGKEPKYIITDQDQAMKTAIKEALPRTRHRFCWWHIRKNLKENNAVVFAQHPGMSDDLFRIVKNSLDQDEFERAWKAAISLHKAEGNKHLNTLWELRNFWVPAYFKDCFYPFSSTTTRSESTNSMWKNYVDHKDTIKRFVNAYHMIQQNCLATLDKKRHRTEEKAPSLETGFPIERQASQVYTNEIFRKFQLELRNRTYFKCSDLAKGRQYFLKKIIEPGEKVWKPYPGEEFDRSEFRVDVDEQKEIYSCSCKKMSRDGIQCCHVLKVMDQTGMIDQLPKSFVIPRWTRNLSESLKVLSTSQGDSMTAQDDETMRFGLAYAELSDICSNACRKEKAYRVLRECTVDMKIKVMAALAEEPDTGILAETLKNPPMSGSKGTKKGDRIKAGSEKKGKGNKAASKCGRCRVKGHRKTNCPDNPEVQERMRIEEEKRKSQQEKRARSMKWPTTPTTPSRTSNGSGQCTPSPGGRRQTPATPTTPLTAGSIYQSLASTPESNITQARHTECMQGSPGQGTESAQSIFRKERSEWRLFGTGEQYE